MTAEFSTILQQFAGACALQTIACEGVNLPYCLEMC
jgi:hypothetical protein